MKNIIIDTSCVLAVVLNEPGKTSIIQKTEETFLLAPESLSWEIGNALSAMFKKERLSLKDARVAWHAAQQILIRFVYPNMERALEIAQEQGIYAYDAYMLAASEEYRAPLLTLDMQLRRCARSLNLKLVEV